jgi:S1-C subfamily serine protease
MKLKCYFKIAFLTTLFILPKATFASTSETNSVVKIYVTTNKMDYYRPWQSQGMSASVGSGAIIEGNKILTNAHVVADQTFIQVKKDGSPKKYTAKVIAVGHDCDLAVLTVEDLDFFNGVKPLRFGKLPDLQDSVTVLGYPQGGGKISITEGVVSRLEVTSYSQSSRKLLTVQIDAAINPGNSGGPVLKNGEIVGIAMQVFQSGQNIGYMIPVPIINHFFEDLKDGHYDEFPVLGIEFSNTENKTLRSFFDITKKEGGILISKVIPFSPASGEVEEGDVVLEIDGVPIGEDGTFHFRNNQRLTISYLITEKQVNDFIKLKVIRNGEVKNLNIRLESFVSLIPASHHFKDPRYYIYGGMVFTVLSMDLLHSWGKKWWEKAPSNFIHYFLGSGRYNVDSKKEIVILLHVLSDNLNVGYHGYGGSIVTKVNEKSFNSFKEFVLLLDEIKKVDEHTILETETFNKIILDNSNIDAVNSAIMLRNNIPSPYSSDVQNWLTSQ